MRLTEKEINIAMLENYISFETGHGLKNYPYKKVTQYKGFTSAHWKRLGTNWVTVISGKLSEENLKDKVTEILSIFNENNISGNWVMESHTQPTNMEEILINQGFVKSGEYPGMFMNITDLIKSKYEKAINQSGLIIKKVQNEEDARKEFKYIYRGSYPEYYTDSKLKEMYDYFIPWIDFSSEADLIHYLGFLNGIPVALSHGLFSSDVVGIYRIKTLEKYRRKGIGTAMTLHIMLKAKEKGIKTAVLQSSEEAYNLYQRLGFKKTTTYKAFDYKPI